MVAKDTIKDISFEDAFRELEGIVRQLEEGRGKLDDAISAYERGVSLKQHCEKKLKSAQMKVEKVVAGSGDNLSTEPIDS